METQSLGVTGTPLPSNAWYSRMPPLGGFRIPVLLIGALVAGLVLAAMGRLMALTWEQYGFEVLTFYWTQVLANAAVRQLLLNTVIVVTLAAVLATFTAAILSWLNERTDASIGTLGRLLPAIPFLMPAIALPLGWVFLAAPGVGALNVLVRAGLDLVGVHLQTGPLHIFSWPGLVFMYTVVLTAFAYLVISSAMGSLDPGLEEAGKMAGAGPIRILFEIVLPSLRPIMLNAFMVTLIPATAMVSVPLVIANGAGIDILSVHILRLVTARYPPMYGQAFLMGVLLLIPVLLLWWVQGRSTVGGRFALIGGRASVGSRMQLGRSGKIVGRSLFLGYVLIAVLLPLAGLTYVSGVSFWQAAWPTDWNLFRNLQAAVTNPQIQRAIMNSLTLGLVTGIAMITAAHVLSYGKRLFPRLGQTVDGLARTPAAIASILLAIGLLSALGGPPLMLGGSVLLLVVGYFVHYLPYATVVATGAHQRIGKDMIEAAKLSGSSDFRTFWSIVTPLSRAPLVGGFLLVFVLVSGDLNISLILASTQQPVVGFVMVDHYEFGGFPQAAMVALLITTVSLTCVTVVMKTITGGPRRARL